MTIAELHGKLAPGRAAGYEYMEDLLTSDVFGTMRYAGWQYGFLDWLLTAESAPVSPRPASIAEHLCRAEIVQVEICFWPALRNGREPDVALLFEFASGNHLLVLIEAKYFSGMSDWDGPALEDEDGVTGSQIIDQVWGLHRMPTGELLAWFDDDGREPADDVQLDRIHLLVTAHTALPVEYYRRAAAKRKAPWPVSAYWLSWTGLGDHIQPHLARTEGGTQALLGDLYRLLQRKGLVPFQGFDTPVWYPHTTSASFWNERWWLIPPWQTNANAGFWRPAHSAKGISDEPTR
jgi:hypothetical protein